MSDKASTWKCPVCGHTVALHALLVWCGECKRKLGRMVTMEKVTK